MGIVVRCRDWFPGGQASASQDLSLPTRRLTVRELIERRVAREFEARSLSDGSAPRSATCEVAAAIDKALAAFRMGGLLVLSPHRQLTNLREEIELTAGEELTFLQLRPLASG